MDWISRLPDGVLCDILSFLPTKQAALTSVLSKRWVKLWTFVPNLNIDDSVFLYPEEGKGEKEGIRQSFVDFVDKVLALQGDSPIKKFSLKSITCVHPDIVNRWICYVLKRGVLDLDLVIDFSYDDIEEGYYLPEEMFVSRTLVELKIRSERCVDWWFRGIRGNHALLPMLKTLDIDSETIHYGKMEMFLPSFPVLEYLRMANMEWIELDDTVSSASIKKLSIHGTGCETLKNPRSISFDTPSLLSLNYSDLVAEDYPLVNMKELFEARINFIVSEDQIKRLRAPNNDWLEEDEDEDNEGSVVVNFGNAVKLMNGIQNVQNLYLSSKYPRVIEGLLHYVTDKCGDVCDCVSREDKGRSLTSCPVKKLEIQGFRGTRREMKMIRHFLESFRCLKEIGIFPEENGPTNFENPGVFELVEEMMHLYNELSSCDVYFLVHGFMRRKWTAQ